MRAQTLKIKEMVTEYQELKKKIFQNDLFIELEEVGNRVSPQEWDRYNQLESIL